MLLVNRDEVLLITPAQYGHGTLKHNIARVK